MKTKDLENILWHERRENPSNFFFEINKNFYNKKILY